MLKQGRGRLNGDAAGAGPGGKCVCPECGATVDHDTAKPCNERECPECGATMTRPDDEGDGLIKSVRGRPLLVPPGLLGLLRKAAAQLALFEEHKHPRYPPGHPKAGQFAPKGGESGPQASLFDDDDIESAEPVEAEAQAQKAGRVTRLSDLAEGDRLLVNGDEKATVVNVDTSLMPHRATCEFDDGETFTIHNKTLDEHTIEHVEGGEAESEEAAENEAVDAFMERVVPLTGSGVDPMAALRELGYAPEQRKQLMEALRDVGSHDRAGLRNAVAALGPPGGEENEEASSEDSADKAPPGAGGDADLSRARTLREIERMKAEGRGEPIPHPDEITNTAGLALRPEMLVKLKSGQLARVAEVDENPEWVTFWPESELKEARRNKKGRPKATTGTLADNVVEIVDESPGNPKAATKGRSKDLTRPAYEGINATGLTKSPRVLVAVRRRGGDHV